MPNRRILELPEAQVPLEGAEQIPIVQEGVTKRVSASDLGGGGGSAPTLIFTLPSGAGDFASNEFNSWGDATVVQESDDAHWSDVNNSIVFDVAGIYRITVRGHCTGDSGWPNDEIVIYGAKIAGNTIGQHARYEATGQGAGFVSGFVQWTDTEIIVATEDMEVVLGMFAKAYTSASQANFQALVTVQRIS